VTRFIIPAPRNIKLRNIRLGFVLAGLYALASAAAGAGADLRGVWMAENNADVSLERARVIVDPPDGKIPYLPGALAQQKQNFAHRASQDPEARCFQPGVPRAAYLRSPFQIFQNARAVYIVYQDVHAYRIIYLDGSPHNEGLGYAMGDSRGHWEGNTLVADAASFSDVTWLDAAGDFHSDQLHVVERYTRTNHDTLMYEATIEDPKVFTRPWKIRMPLRLQTGIQILEDECEEGENGRRHHVRAFNAAK
jgi:hypothetical protein